MDQLAACQKCGQKIAKYKCARCGALVCKDCYDKETGKCIYCARGKDE